MTQKRSLTIVFSVLTISIICYSVYTQIINTNQDKDVYNLIYYQGGEYYDYVSTLISLFEGLALNGVVNQLDLSAFEKTENMKSLWDYLCDNIDSDYLKMEKSNYYSSNWSEIERLTNRAKLINYVHTYDGQYNNLILAMGTWAGLDLANDLHTTPTMVLSTTNVVNAGILKNKYDYSLKHVFAEYEPNIYLRQINLFHAIFKFDTLGITYTNTTDGKAYIAYDDIHLSAKKRGFDIITCEYEELTNVIKLIENGKQCVDYLSTRADAMYFGDQLFLKYDKMPYVIQATIDNKIPTW